MTPYEIMTKIGMAWTTETCLPYEPLWSGSVLHTSYWKAAQCPVHGWVCLYEEHPCELRGFRLKQLAPWEVFHEIAHWLLARERQSLPDYGFGWDPETNWYGKEFDSLSTIQLQDNNWMEDLTKFLVWAIMLWSGCDISVVEDRIAEDQYNYPNLDPFLMLYDSD